MSQVRQRSEIVQVTDTVQLRVLFKDGFDNPVDLDTFPAITLIQPSGLVAVGPTSAGVYRLETGRYGFDYKAGINGPLGVWNDNWKGQVNGFQVSASLQFIISEGQVQAPNSDGYMHLGDRVGFNYSQTAILNINKIMELVRARLRSSGKAKKTDEHGNVTYIDCDIFSVENLTSFIVMSLSNFNQIPYFTWFTFEDTWFIDEWMAILAEGASIYAMASQALLERGREFSITDNSISFTPPTVSELLNTQYSSNMTTYNENLKYIKNSMRPHVRGLGTMTITAGNPNVMRLRHLRARRFY